MILGKVWGPEDVQKTDTYYCLHILHTERRLFAAITTHMTVRKYNSGVLLVEMSIVVSHELKLNATVETRHQVWHSNRPDCNSAA